MVIFNATSVTIKCKFENNSKPDADDQYICKFKKDDTISSGPRITIDKVEGIHTFPRSRNINIKILSITLGQKLKLFPEIQTNDFKDVEVIEVMHSTLKEITHKDLKQFVHLKYLNLQDNKIETIEKNLFLFNQELHEIYLNGNKISYIDVDVFAGLGNLNTLNLTNNKCKVKFEIAQTKTEVMNYVQRIKAGDCIPENIFVKIKELKIQNKNIHFNNTGKDENYRVLHETIEYENKAVDEFDDIINMMLFCCISLLGTSAIFGFIIIKLMINSKNEYQNLRMVQVLNNRICEEILNKSNQ